MLKHRLFTVIVMISIESVSASDGKMCDKTKTLKKAPEQISHPYIEISGTEKYQTNNDNDYQRIIVKTIEGFIPPKVYKQYLANCASISAIN